MGNTNSTGLSPYQTLRLMRHSNMKTALEMLGNSTQLKAMDVTDYVFKQEDVALLSQLRLNRIRLSNPGIIVAKKRRTLLKFGSSSEKEQSTDYRAAILQILLDMDSLKNLSVVLRNDSQQPLIRLRDLRWFIYGNQVTRTLFELDITCDIEDKSLSVTDWRLLEASLSRLVSLKRYSARFFCPESAGHDLLPSFVTYPSTKLQYISFMKSTRFHSKELFALARSLNAIEEGGFKQVVLLLLGEPGFQGFKHFLSSMFRRGCFKQFTTRVNEYHLLDPEIFEYWALINHPTLLEWGSGNPL